MSPGTGHILVARYTVGIVTGHMKRCLEKTVGRLKTDIVAAIKTAYGMVGTIFISHTNTPALMAGLGTALPVMLLKVRAEGEVCIHNTGCGGEVERRSR